MPRVIRPHLLLAALWPLVLVSLALPSETLTIGMCALLAGFVALSIGRAPWQIRVLCGALGALIVALCVAYDGWGAIYDGLRGSLIIAAFLPTMMLLRATAEQRPEITEARRLFAALDDQARGRGILVGSHVIGSVLIIGVFALLAPIIGPDADEDERRQVVGLALRGMCMSVLWSPFAIGMGLASSYLPAVKLFEILPLGLCFAALGLMTSHLMFDRSGGIFGLWRALAGFAPVLPAIAVAAALVIALTATTTLTTLQALVIGMPVLCLAVLAMTGRKNLIEAVRRTRTTVGLLGNELSIVAFAMSLAAVVEAAVGAGVAADWLARMNFAPIAIIGLTVFIVTAGGLVGLHPFVTVTVLLALLIGVPTGIADIVLLQTMLVGWALSTMISVSAVSIATASAMFGIAPQRLVRGENLIFVVVFGALSVFILAAVNHVVMR